MLRILLAAVIALAVPAIAEAKVFKLGTPVIASIDLPGNWKPNEYDKGVEAESADGEIYLAVEVASVASVDKAIEEAIDYLVKKGVKVDDKSVKTSEGKINQLPLFEISAKGTDKDGPTEISIAVVVVNETTALVVTYWGTEEGEKANAEALTKIVQSIKKAG